ncbi:hypothetical protein AGMMS49940_14560 [Spirochaetia bacterium]|nr:hypothetical protein AGMMS49940_14560 [Spirochaetia bacterium]
MKGKRRQSAEVAVFVAPNGTHQLGGRHIAYCQFTEGGVSYSGCPVRAHRIGPPKIGPRRQFGPGGGFTIEGSKNSLKVTVSRYFYTGGITIGIVYPVPGEVYRQGAVYGLEEPDSGLWAEHYRPGLLQGAAVLVQGKGIPRFDPLVFAVNNQGRTAFTDEEVKVTLRADTGVQHRPAGDLYHIALGVQQHRGPASFGGVYGHIPLGKRKEGHLIFRENLYQAVFHQADPGPLA